MLAVTLLLSILLTAQETSLYRPWAEATEVRGGPEQTTVRVQEGEGVPGCEWAVPWESVSVRVAHCSRETPPDTSFLLQFEEGARSFWHAEFASSSSAPSFRCEMELADRHVWLTCPSPGGDAKVLGAPREGLWFKAGWSQHNATAPLRLWVDSPEHALELPVPGPVTRAWLHGPRVLVHEIGGLDAHSLAGPDCGPALRTRDLDYNTTRDGGAVQFEVRPGRGFTFRTTLGHLLSRRCVVY